MVRVLGLDIGGANIKAAYIHVQDSMVREFEAALEYFPFWKRDEAQFCAMLSVLRGKVASEAVLDGVGVTVTAELSDAYQTKREGVNHILDCVSHVFQDTQIFVVTADATLTSVEEAKAKPLWVAAANWAATGWMIAQNIRDCIVVDVGSTTTSIIPIINGKVAATGKTDLEKLANGELVYTGSLRTNVAATINTVPLRGGTLRISSELFAQSGDVHLVLENISVEDYTAETPDGKGKTFTEAQARLARVVCADTEMLAEQEILQLATYIYSKQVEQISGGLNQVYMRLTPNAKATVPAVVTGLGKNFLAKKAAEKAGVTQTIDLEELMPKGTAVASPAVGTALMAATELEGRKFRWPR